MRRGRSLMNYLRSWRSTTWSIWRLVSRGLLSAVLIVPLTACSTILTSLPEILSPEVAKPLPPPSALYARPAGVSLKAVDWTIVGKVQGQLDQEMLAKFGEAHDAMFCTAAKGYENLGLNLADIIRNIKDLQALVVRYEADRLDAWERFREVNGDKAS